jgi:hypothetical protein
MTGEIPLSHTNQFYLLLLSEQFGEEIPEGLTDWFIAFKEHARKHYPICGICGIYSVRKMCNGFVSHWPICLNFVYHDEIVKHDGSIF